MGKDDKEDSGFGFKDKAKALETLRLLEQHDANYRRLTVRGLLGRAKRVLSSEYTWVIHTHLCQSTGSYVATGTDQTRYRRPGNWGK